MSVWVFVVYIKIVKSKTLLNYIFHFFFHDIFNVFQIPNPKSTSYMIFMWRIVRVSLIIVAAKASLKIIWILNTLCIIIIYNIHVLYSDLFLHAVCFVETRAEYWNEWNHSYIYIYIGGRLLKNVYYRTRIKNK